VGLSVDGMVERKEHVRKIAFMFPGQGSYEAGMGRDIAEAVPEAMAVYEAGSEACGIDLKQVCFHGPVEDLLDTKLQQPALVATSLAIHEAVRARGFDADFVVGHSVGEFAALGAAGAISHADAIALVRHRGIIMAEAAAERPGSMAAILGLADEVVEGLCRKIANVWPANYNCPGQIVISGHDDAVGHVCAEAEREGARRAVRLRVSGAFHSPLVVAAADKLRPAVERIHFHDPRTAFISTVTAKLEDANHIRELLVRQLTAPVKFTQAARVLVGKGVTVFVEVGPGNVLTGLLKRIDRSVRTISVSNLQELDELEERLA
jgi:[acyl-carrier-protein] S-malonyltransferase